MGEQRNRWNWEVSGFEPRKTSSFEQGDFRSSGAAPLVRRYSISTASALSHSESSKLSLSSKLQRLKDQVKVNKVLLYFIF